MPALNGSPLVNGSLAPSRGESRSPLGQQKDGGPRSPQQNGFARPGSRGHDAARAKNHGRLEDSSSSGSSSDSPSRSTSAPSAPSTKEKPDAQTPEGRPVSQGYPHTTPASRGGGGGPPDPSQLPPSLTTRQFNKLRAMSALPEDFDLVAPAEEGGRVRLEREVERLSDLLFSALHLRAVFLDPAALLRFTAFLAAHRPQSLPTLVYYLDATKALRALEYANAVARGLEPVLDPDEDAPGDDAASKPLSPIKENTVNQELLVQADRAFALLVRLDLPAYTAYLFTQVIKTRMVIPLNRAPKSDETFQGFAEVFCLTDPRRQDNPIIFASPAFHQLTQYSMNYIIGRNCRFLQGPRTHRASPARIRKGLESQVPHWEVFVNYRRDGAPFLNLLLCTPLFDEWGAVRYHLGAQIDVSDVVDDSPELDALQRALARAERLPADATAPADLERAAREWQDHDAFQSLVEMLDMQELQAIRAWEERLTSADEARQDGVPEPASREGWSEEKERRPGLPIKQRQSTAPIRGMHYGLYDKFLLVRPAPSLRILFASPSLSDRHTIQARLLDKLAVSGRTRFELTQALEEGREVTAKVGWRASPDAAALTRWIVFTPLVGRRGNVGVWMVILEDHVPEGAERRPNAAANRARVGHRGAAAAAAAHPASSNGMGMGSVDGVLDEADEDHADGDFDDELPAPVAPARGPAIPPRGGSRHGANISWSGPEVPPGLRSPTLEWVSARENAALYGGGGGDEARERERGAAGAYVSLEERLREKREREGMLVGNGAAGVGIGGGGRSAVPARRTYKSLSPDTFINTSD